jgi:hypothetical protein
MEAANWHRFQVITKRSSLMRDYLRRRYAACMPPSHVWFGVSVEDANARNRIEHLRAAPAVIRFLSIEPLLGPLGSLDLTGFHWVILGGESGPRARPMELTWAREVRDACSTQFIPLFFKQWGGILRNPAGGCSTVENGTGCQTGIYQMGALMLLDLHLCERTRDRHVPANSSTTSSWSVAGERKHSESSIDSPLRFEFL